MPAMLAAAACPRCRMPAMLAAGGGGWQQDDGSECNKMTVVTPVNHQHSQASAESCARPREAVIKKPTTAGGKAGHARQPCHRNTRKAGRVDTVARPVACSSETRSVFKAVRADARQ